MASYRSTNCKLGKHEDCSLAGDCACNCHKLEKQKTQLEHYVSLSCKWNHHAECKDQQGHCSCQCHRQ